LLWYSGAGSLVNFDIALALQFALVNSGALVALVLTVAQLTASGTLVLYNSQLTLLTVLCGILVTCNAMCSQYSGALCAMVVSNCSIYTTFPVTAAIV
jgi:hypothetical protein